MTDDLPTPMLRLLAILILLLQPLTGLRSLALTGFPPATEPAATCCGGECTCCSELGYCPCAGEAPAKPAEPTPAPATPTSTPPTRLYLPPAHVLFTLPEADPSPQAPSETTPHTGAADSHARALALLCVWRN